MLPNSNILETRVYFGCLSQKIHGVYFLTEKPLIFSPKRALENYFYVRMATRTYVRTYVWLYVCLHVVAISCVLRVVMCCYIAHLAAFTAAHRRVHLLLFPPPRVLFVDCRVLLVPAAF